jgi:hypothetical protein
MKAIEMTGTVDTQGTLSLDGKLLKMSDCAVKVIILYPEDAQIDDEIDEDDTSIEEIKASLTRALQEAAEGKRIPLSQMWEGIELPS